ncbi:TetR/AcrR family transcriptional regulator C-terminal domain-containing protein [Prescottella equi]
MKSTERPSSSAAMKATAQRGKGRPPSLTENQIVDAALTIIRADGLEALSMRRLSRELGRSQMAAYSHVTDKQELLDLVARRTLADVRIPEENEGPWDIRLRLLIERSDAQLRRHPGIASLLLQRMLYTDRRLVDAVMSILLEGGLEKKQVVLAYAMIHTYLFGRYQVALDDVPRDSVDVQSAIAQVMPHLDELRGVDYFNFGINTLIDGLRLRAAEAGQ